MTEDTSNEKARRIGELSAALAAEKWKSEQQHVTLQQLRRQLRQARREVERLQTLLNATEAPKWLESPEPSNLVQWDEDRFPRRHVLNAQARQALTDAGFRRISDGDRPDGDELFPADEAQQHQGRGRVLALVLLAMLCAGAPWLVAWGAGILDAMGGR